MRSVRGVLRLGACATSAVLAFAAVPAEAASAAPGGASASPACKTWVHVKSPNAGSGDNDLFGVAATSAGDAWAVGQAFTGVVTKNLIEHWNGTAWKLS